MQTKMKESEPILDVKNLFASTDNLPILKGVSITVYPGEIHAIMGKTVAVKALFQNYCRAPIIQNY